MTNVIRIVCLPALLGFIILGRRVARRFAFFQFVNRERSQASIPVVITGKMLNGILHLTDTPHGRRLRFNSNSKISENELVVEIDRETTLAEVLVLERAPGDHQVFVSKSGPRRPYKFSARLRWRGERVGGEVFHFEMK